MRSFPHDEGSPSGGQRAQALASHSSLDSCVCRAPRLSRAFVGPLTPPAGAHQLRDEICRSGYPGYDHHETQCRQRFGNRLGRPHQESRPHAEGRNARREHL